MKQQRDENLWERAEMLAVQGYEVSVAEDILSNGQRVYLVSNPELPGCKAYGVTQEEAEAALEEVRKDFIYFLLEDGLPVPSPRGKVAEVGTTVMTTSFTVTGNMFIKAGSNIEATLERVIDPKTRNRKYSYVNFTSNP